MTLGILSNEVYRSRVLRPLLSLSKPCPELVEGGAAFHNRRMASQPSLTIILGNR